jgi:hypothetical protein
LEPKNIQAEMSDIGVEEAADRDPPELEAVPEFGKELVL